MCCRSRTTQVKSLGERTVQSWNAQNKLLSYSSQLDISIKLWAFTASKPQHLYVTRDAIDSFLIEKGTLGDRVYRVDIASSTLFRIIAIPCDPDNHCLA